MVCRSILISMYRSRATQLVSTVCATDISCFRSVRLPVYPVLPRVMNKASDECMPSACARLYRNLIRLSISMTPGTTVRKSWYGLGKIFWLQRCSSLFLLARSCISRFSTRFYIALSVTHVSTVFLKSSELLSSSSMLCWQSSTDNIRSRFVQIKSYSSQQF